jgi:hypothetical protein
MGSIFVGIIALGAGCSGGGVAGRCQVRSSSSSGGICRVDLTCGGFDLAASCTETDCACIVDEASTGQRFPADGFCDQTEVEQGRRAEASCQLPSDAGPTAEASGSDPRCPPSAYTGMACRAEDVGATCPGTAACFCSGPVNISTTCVCEEGTALGRSWRCADDCESACAKPDAGAPDAAKPDQGAAGTACLLAPQCIESTTGSASSLALIAKVCGQVGGTYVAGCETDHHDQCMVAKQEVVLYTDKTDPFYDSLASEASCNQLAGVFTP